MATVKYIKPSGKEIEVNDDKFTQAYAAKNGWKQVKAGKPKKNDSEAKLDK